MPSYLRLFYFSKLGIKPNRTSLSILSTLSTLFISFFTTTAFAVGTIEFTQEEIATHRANINTITKTAAQCLDNTYQDHKSFFTEYGISKYYGVRRKDYATPAGRLKALVEKYNFDKDRANEIVKKQVAISCVDLTRFCLGKGFDQAGLRGTWKRLDAYVIANGVSGVYMQYALQKLGWKIYYWNPDPSQNNIWDNEDRAINPPKIKDGKEMWNPVWGGHAYRYSTATRENKPVYYNLPVDNATKLVGFGSDLPRDFEKVEFFVGTTHAGYHVFPGKFGEVIEAHSTREMGSIDNRQSTI